MSNWMRYLLEANAYLCVSYGLYWLLLRKQTFYTANRAYLLLSIMVCFALPAMKVSFEPEVIIAVSQMADAPTTASNGNLHSTTPSQQVVLGPFKAIAAIYWVGCASMLVLISLRLYSVLKLITGKNGITLGNYTVIKLAQAKVPFSFLHYLFVSDDADIDETILRHESVHMRQNHSLDILVTEALKALCWFNPVVYLLQNSLKAVHEYEADRCAALDEPDQYVHLLIGQACMSSGIPLTSDFSDTKLLKTRIMKLYQKRSGKLARLNYLAALPLSVGMLLASSAAFSKDHSLITIHLGSSRPLTTGHYHSKYYAQIPKVSIDAKKATIRNILIIEHKGKVAWSDKLVVHEKPHISNTFTPTSITDADKHRLLEAYDIRISVLSSSNIEHLNEVQKITFIETLGYKGPIKFPPPMITWDTNQKGPIKFPPPAIKRNTNKKVKVVFPPPVIKWDTDQKDAMKFSPPKRVKHSKMGNVIFPPPVIKWRDSSGSSKAHDLTDIPPPSSNPS